MKYKFAFAGNDEPVFEEYGPRMAFALFFDAHRCPSVKPVFADNETEQFFIEAGNAERHVSQVLNLESLYGAVYDVWEVYARDSQESALFLTEEAARNQTVIDDVDLVSQSQVYLSTLEHLQLETRGYLL